MYLNETKFSMDQSKGYMIRTLAAFSEGFNIFLEFKLDSKEVTWLQSAIKYIFLRETINYISGY